METICVDGQNKFASPPQRLDRLQMQTADRQLMRRELIEGDAMWANKPVKQTGYHAERSGHGSPCLK